MALLGRRATAANGDGLRGDRPRDEHRAGWPACRVTAILPPVSGTSADHALAHLERRLREALEADPTVRWAYLFGSAARGEAFHDLDVGVMLDPQARGAVALGRIVGALEAAAAGVPVDVTDLASAAPALNGRIVREGRVLVDHAPSDRTTWALEANRRALDIEPWLAEGQRLRAAALRNAAASDGGPHGRS
jgi:predicted nucleotidyltransferase